MYTTRSITVVSVILAINVARAAPAAPMPKPKTANSWPAMTMVRSGKISRKLKQMLITIARQLVKTGSFTCPTALSIAT